MSGVIWKTHLAQTKSRGLQQNEDYDPWARAGKENQSKRKIKSKGPDGKNLKSIRIHHPLNQIYKHTISISVAYLISIKIVSNSDKGIFN